MGVVTEPAYIRPWFYTSRFQTRERKLIGIRAEAQTIGFLESTPHLLWKRIRYMERYEYLDKILQGTVVEKPA